MSRFAALFVGICVCSIPACCGFAESLGARVRRPVAMIAGPAQLLVANQRGTVSKIEIETGRVLDERQVGKSIVDLAVVQQSKDEVVALALCPQDRQLLLIQSSRGSIESRSMGEIDSSAIRVRVFDSGRKALVAERWRHRVEVLAFDAQISNIESRSKIALPFAPRELLMINERFALVAEAFGSRIATIDLQRQSVHSIERIRGHNIRGMALTEDRKRVLVAHQRMNPLARADYDDLHWGVLVTNGVRVLETSEFQFQLLTKTADDTQPQSNAIEGWLDHFGGIGNATGDPSGVITGPNELMAVTFGGVGEILVRRAGYSTRMSVGRHPEALATNNRQLFVANRFDDTITVIDLNSGEIAKTIRLGPSGELSAVDRGEMLFFDAKLSHDGWMSCHSCHTDGHSSGLLVDTLGDGDYGAPKRIPSLLGTRGTSPWAWNGGMKTLEAQVRKSVTTTMHGTELTDQQANDLVSFLESLPAAPARERQSKHEMAAGRAVFEAKGCSRCHSRSILTSKGVFDVGLLDEHGKSRFNPPSLRGVSQRTPLFHDGRAKSIEDVIVKFQHMLNAKPTKKEREFLLRYLKGL